MNEPATYPGAGDVRPVVRTADTGNLGLWIFGAIVLIAGLALFLALNSRRQDLAASSTLPAGQGSGLIAAPPPLPLPASFADYVIDPAARLRRARVTPDPAANGRPQAVTRVVERTPSLSPDDLASLGLQRIQPPDQVFVQPPVPVPDFATTAERLDPGERVTAGRLANPSLTVPKGTIVAAVLETALDSSRPGAVRAIVSRDVRSFDGSRVLIPRGSRLYGEYNADVSAGQKRALIRWQRLTRPDAVVVNLDSPAADPLGRAGVEGKVNSHFFARFGGAILQSVLNVGVGLATRSVSGNDTVIVGLPGSTQQVTGQLTQQAQVQPTLRVRQGTSVSVFVARDLDFSTVDG